MVQGPKVWRHRTGEIVLDRTRVMGVLNVTPDSFSDGNRYFMPEAAIHRGLDIADQGADLIDIGGESTRPRSETVPAEEEWRRVKPVLEALARKVDLPLSIDTRKPEIAEKAVAAGAAIVNDVTGFRDPHMIHLVAAAGCGGVIMHMQSDPRTMQEAPHYDDVVGEIHAFLETQLRSAVRGGVPRESIAVDPGIGFGKTLEHNLSLLRHLDAFVALGQPVVVGVSRKSFIDKLGAGGQGERLPGSLAAAALGVAHGAHVIRAHDVLETVQAMRVVDAIRLQS